MLGVFIETREMIWCCVVWLCIRDVWYELVLNNIDVDAVNVYYNRDAVWPSPPPPPPPLYTQI